MRDGRSSRTALRPTTRSTLKGPQYRGKSLPRRVGCCNVMYLVLNHTRESTTGSKDCERFLLTCAAMRSLACLHRSPGPAELLMCLRECVTCTGPKGASGSSGRVLNVLEATASLWLGCSTRSGYAWTKGCLNRPKSSGHEVGPTHGKGHPGPSRYYGRSAYDAPQQVQV